MDANVCVSKPWLWPKPVWLRGSDVASSHGKRPSMATAIGGGSSAVIMHGFMKVSSIFHLFNSSDHIVGIWAS